jgi:hypothetical protein
MPLQLFLMQLLSVLVGRVGRVTASPVLLVRLDQMVGTHRLPQALLQKAAVVVVLMALATGLLAVLVVVVVTIPAVPALPIKTHILDGHLTAIAAVLVLTYRLAMGQVVAAARVQLAVMRLERRVALAVLALLLQFLVHLFITAAVVVVVSTASAMLAARVVLEVVGRVQAIKMVLVLLQTLVVAGAAAAIKVVSLVNIAAVMAVPASSLFVTSINKVKHGTFC